MAKVRFGQRGEFLQWVRDSLEAPSFIFLPHYVSMALRGKVMWAGGGRHTTCYRKDRESLEPDMPGAYA